MLSRLITAETGNYDRASLKIPSLTVSLGKQLELISPADLIYNHTFSWRRESHFAPLIRRRKPRPLRFLVVQLYPCWYNLSISNYETMDTSVLSHRFSSFDEKKEKRNFNHCTREISFRHSWHSTLCRIPLNSRIRARLLKREDDPLSPTPSRSPSRSGVGEII